MEKKNVWFNAIFKCSFVSSCLYILLDITKLLVVHIYTPGAQGGTGGW